MCQAKVYLETAAGRTEMVMEDVTEIRATEDGWLVSSLFQEPRFIPAARLQQIDFLARTVMLTTLNREA